jgi:Mg/Co/Ni transporter MgtE
MNDEWYFIKDLTAFVNYSRSLIFDTFSTNQKESLKNPEKYNNFIETLSLDERQELDSVLSLEESSAIVKSMVKSQQNKKTKEIRYILTDKLFISILESLNDRMTSNILNNLVNKGLVETAYDSDTNDFIFWVKDENKEKPDTD